MHQAEDLLLTILHLELLRPELSVGIFTGYSQFELVSGRYSMYGQPDATANELALLWENLVHYIDFAIMGRYDCNRPVSNRPLVSSANQELINYSDRYADDEFSAPEIEIVISEDGFTQITGFPTNKELCAA